MNRTAKNAKDAKKIYLFSCLAWRTWRPWRFNLLGALRSPTPPGADSIERNRRAISTLEVLVSLTLLMSVLSVSLPLIVRHGHLLVAQRHYRLALDELSNQLDRLTSLPAEAAQQSTKQLSLSPFTAQRLPAAKLSGELKPADIGQRITLHLTWREPHEEDVSMTGWIFPRVEPSSKPAPPRGSGNNSP